MGDIITVAFPHEHSQQAVQEELETLAKRVFAEKYNNNICDFLWAFQHECADKRPHGMKLWLQEKLGAVSITSLTTLHLH